MPETLTTTPNWEQLAKEGAPRLDYAKANWDAGNAVMINDVIYKPTPKTDLNLNVNSGSEISGGAPREKVDPIGTKEVADALAINNTIDSVKAQIGFKDPSAPLSAEELADIEKKAINAGKEYDPIIAEAEAARKKGLPTALISAGERGGLMSTQFAGSTAAPEQTIAEARKKIKELSDLGVQVDYTDPITAQTFFGEGGELKRIQSVYDSSIQNAKKAKERAVAAARVAAEQAIRTGKSDWNKQAMQLLELAQNANKQAIDLAQAKVDLISSYDKIKQARTTYNVSKINDLAATGTPLDATTKQEVDDLYGEGYADKYYNIAQGKASIAEFKDLYDLLKDVPVGKKIMIGNTEVEGLSDAAIKTYQLTKANGEEVLVRYNPITNETVVKELDVIGKTTKGGDDTGLGLTASQLAEAEGQYYAKNPGKTKADFDALSYEQKKALAMASASIGPTLDMIKQDAINAKAAGSVKSAQKYVNNFAEYYKRAPTAAELAVINEAFNEQGDSSKVGEVVGAETDWLGNWISSFVSGVVED